MPTPDAMLLGQFLASRLGKTAMLRYTYHNEIVMPGGATNTPGASQEYESMTVPQHTPTLNLPQEVWRAVPGYPQYTVSSLGRVRGARGWLLRPGPSNGRNYPTVALYRDARRHTVTIHRIVALAFLGPCPLGMEVHHEDDNHDNYVLSNLRYVTRGDNQRICIARGRRATGMHHTIEEADVVAIRASDRPSRELAARYGISASQIRSIWRRDCWRNVPEGVRHADD